MKESEMVEADMTLSARFWAKVEKRGPDECWNWTGTASAGRYGAIKVGGKRGKDLKAHRIQMIWQGGDIDGRVVRHTCDNGLCVNPRHLRIGTQLDNVQDMMAKGRNRQPAGSDNGKARLGVVAIVAIKEALASGMRCADVARSFGLPHLTVYNIASGKTYKHQAAEIVFSKPGKSGSDHFNAKLTDECVAAMRQRYRSVQNYTAVGNEFGVPSGMARRAITGERWPHVVLGEAPIPERIAIKQYGRRLLTDAQAIEVKKSSGSSTEVGKRFGISGALVLAIRKGRAYAWIDDSEQTT